MSMQILILEQELGTSDGTEKVVVTTRLVVQLLSYNIWLTKAHPIYKYPDPSGEDEPTYWHRDIENCSNDLGPGGNTRLQIKIAYYLSGTMEHGSGNTWLAPGSNKYTRPLEIPKGVNDS